MSPVIVSGRRLVETFTLVLLWSEKYRRPSHRDIVVYWEFYVALYSALSGVPDLVGLESEEESFAVQVITPPVQGESPLLGSPMP